MIFKFVLAVLLLVKISSAANPGFCPKPLGFPIGLCPYACTEDAHCILTFLKCCDTACGGKICVPSLSTEPATTTTTASPTTTTPRPGVCPGTSKPKSSCGIFEVASCVKDSDCLIGTHKCCSNGCALNCRIPDSKAGTCPSNLSTTCAIKVCSADSGCPLNLKCCANGCRCAIPNP